MRSPPFLQLPHLLPCQLDLLPPHLLLPLQLDLPLLFLPPTGHPDPPSSGAPLIRPLSSSSSVPPLRPSTPSAFAAPPSGPPPTSSFAVPNVRPPSSFGAPPLRPPTSSFAVPPASNSLPFRPVGPPPTSSFGAPVVGPPPTSSYVVPPSGPVDSLPKVTFGSAPPLPPSSLPGAPPLYPSNDNTNMMKSNIPPPKYNGVSSMPPTAGSMGYTNGTQAPFAAPNFCQTQAPVTSRPDQRYPQQPIMNYNRQPAMNYNNNYNQGNVVSEGWNRAWGTDNIDLLQQRAILPSEEIKPPKPVLAQEFVQNCPPETFRCTFTKVPETSSILSKAKLPFGILIHPFRDLDSLSVVTCQTIVRCRPLPHLHQSLRCLPW